MKMIVLSCLYEKLIALKYRDAIAFNEFDQNRVSMLECISSYHYNED